MSFEFVRSATLPAPHEVIRSPMRIKQAIRAPVRRPRSGHLRLFLTSLVM